jgi:hypothetical protein
VKDTKKPAEVADILISPAPYRLEIGPLPILLFMLLTPVERSAMDLRRLAALRTRDGIDAATYAALAQAEGPK